MACAERARGSPQQGDDFAKRVIEEARHNHSSADAETARHGLYLAQVLDVTEAYIASRPLQLEILVGNDLGSTGNEPRQGNLLFGEKRFLQRIDHREIGRLQEHLLS